MSKLLPSNLKIYPPKTTTTNKQINKQQQQQQKQNKAHTHEKKPKKNNNNKNQNTVSVKFKLLVFKEVKVKQKQNKTNKQTNKNKTKQQNKTKQSVIFLNLKAMWILSMFYFSVFYILDCAEYTDAFSPVIVLWQTCTTEMEDRVTSWGLLRKDYILTINRSNFQIMNTL